MTYKATMTPKGKLFQYVVTDEAGNIISKRTSKRDNFVACTVFGDFYFGRRDLIGKGEHGRFLNSVLAKKAQLENDPEGAYREYCQAVSKMGRNSKPSSKEQFLADDTSYCACWIERLKVVFIEK